MRSTDLHLNQKSNILMMHFIFKKLLLSSVYTKVLEAITNSVARGIPNIRIVASKYHFQGKEPDILREMINFKWCNKFTI